MASPASGPRGSGPSRSASEAEGEIAAFLQATLDAMPFRVAVLDDAGVILGVNEAWRAFGEENGLDLPEAGIGTSYLAACTSGDVAAYSAEQAAQGLREVLSDQRDSFKLTYPCHGPEQEAWYRMQVVPLAPVHGADRVLVVHRDITEEHRTRQALEEQQRTLDLLSENLHEILWVVSPDLEATRFASPAAGAFWGLPDELVQSDPMAWLEVVHPDDREEVAQRIPEDLAGFRSGDLEEAMFTFRIRRGGDGELAWIELRAYPARDEEGELTALVGICEDVTQRHQAERERGHLLEVLEASPDIVGRSDGQGRITYLNPAAEATWGPLEELAGTSIAALHPPEVAEHLLEHALPAARETGVWTGETALIDRDGRRVPVLQSIVAHGERGETSFSTIIKDLTPQKRAEAEGRERARQEARARELDQLLRASTHELLTATRTVGSFAQLLGRHLAAGDQARVEEDLAYLRQGAGNLQRLLEALRTYAEVTRPSGASTSVPLEDTLATVTSMLADRVEATGATIEIGELPVVRGHPTQLRRLFTELLSNALTFHGQAPPRIHVASRRVEGAWLVTVADQGSGFDPAHAQRVFGMFERVHDRPELPGVGMGLTICQRIVENHGGQISLETEPGRGTTVHVTLPAADPEADQTDGQP